MNLLMRRIIQLEWTARSKHLLIYLLFGKSGFFLSFLLKGAVMLAVEKTGGLLALSHNAAVSSGPLAGFPQPATVALVVAEAHRKTFFL